MVSSERFLEFVVNVYLVTVSGYVSYVCNWLLSAERFNSSLQSNKGEPFERFEKRRSLVVLPFYTSDVVGT